MKKVLALTLFLMLAVGNFAYAFSVGSCTMENPFLQSAKTLKGMPSCCQPNGGDCPFRLKSDKKLFPQLLNAAQENAPALVSTKNIDFKISSFRSEFSGWGHSSESPPGLIPLYSLFSTYRI